MLCQLGDKSSPRPLYYYSAATELSAYQVAGRAESRLIPVRQFGKLLSASTLILQRLNLHLVVTLFPV